MSYLKKFMSAVFISIIVISSAGALFAEDVVNSGVLTYLGTTEEEFQNGLDELRKAVAPLVPEEDRTWADEEVSDMLEGFIASLVKTRRVVKFYDSLLNMQMALKSGKIDEMTLPESVGLYLTTNNPDYGIQFSLNMLPSTISFGFAGDNTALRDKFNAAIKDMKKDGTLSKLSRTYIDELGTNEPARIEFEKFAGAKTVKAAVTGDLPPIDFIAADGSPSGYNTAILSEIGKRIKMNIEVVSINAGARSSALASGRADVVFWYRNTEGFKISKKVNNKKSFMKDKAEDVILSEPYYEWDTDLVVGRSK